MPVISLYACFPFPSPLLQLHVKASVPLSSCQLLCHPPPIPIAVTFWPVGIPYSVNKAFCTSSSSVPPQLPPSSWKCNTPWRPPPAIPTNFLASPGSSSEPVRKSSYPHYPSLRATGEAFLPPLPQPGTPARAPPHTGTCGNRCSETSDSSTPHWTYAPG